jgi:hypothetical protein
MITIEEKTNEGLTFAVGEVVVSMDGSTGIIYGSGVSGLAEDFVRVIDITNTEQPCIEEWLTFGLNKFEGTITITQ